MTFAIEIDDSAIQQALTELQSRVASPAPFLQAVGEDIVARAKARFGSGTAPDGTPWAPNKPATVAAYLARRGAKGKKAAALAGAKRPLHGESHDLAREFHAAATADSLAVTSGPIYAAIQHLGGKKSQFSHLWGDIPARPFMPLTPAGELDPKERGEILAALEEFIRGGAGR